MTGHKLCTWLVGPEGEVIAEVQRKKDHRFELDAFNSGLWHELGIRGARGPRIAWKAQPSGDDFSKPQPTMDQWDSLLRPISTLLFPKRIVPEMVSRRIDTLIVVPILITVEQSPGSFPYPEDRSPRARNRFIFALSTLPFGALPIHGDKRLNDLVSVIVAPGFSIFAQGPIPVRHLGRESLIVGDPTTIFDPLPGARLEATEIARTLGVQALIADRATKRKVLSVLQEHPERISLIHLATHGIADSKNPLDESFLAFADDHLTAREIGLLRLNDRPLLSGRTLVVMSACETALGKDFSAGTIGLARAWQWAGAGQVAMTLWAVDDAATQKLMTEFIGFIVRGEAADKALQKAMKQVRRDDPNPASWASFQLFGSVESLR